MSTIHLVLDNLNIHRCKSLTELFGAEFGAEIWDRFTVHYKPTHGSWLNQAEIEIGLFTRQCRGAPSNPGSKDLTTRIACLEPPHQRRSNKIDFRFDRKAARQKFGYKRQLFKRSQT